MKTKISDIISFFEKIAPFSLQESYDNSGLIVGNKNTIVKKILVTLDVTEAVVSEAVAKKANLIVAHHPIIFRGLKSLTGKNYVERTIIEAIKNDIAILAVHTNADNIDQGVNHKICEILQLQNCKILRPMQNKLKKLATFVPKNHAQKVRNAIFEAGAGHIGNYDNCSYNISGEGTFRANDAANPFVGKIGSTHTEPEIKVETIFPTYKQNQIISALKNAHPYEEVAYDIYPLDNISEKNGAGMIGELAKETDEKEFLLQLKNKFFVPVLKHTKLLNKKIKKVALCGGAGSFLLKDAIKQKADIFISGDFTYHQFFDAENKLIIADIGHYESEQFTKQLFFDIIKKNFTTFDTQISETNTNPVNYF